MTSQRKRAFALARALVAVNPWSDDAAHLWRMLDAVLGEAQNAPPDGCADGTIDKPLWDALRRLSVAHSVYAGAITRLKELGQNG